MAARFLALLIGIFFAFAGSQAPRFTDQYFADLHQWTRAAETGPGSATSYDLADHYASLIRARDFARPLVVVRDSISSPAVRAHVSAALKSYQPAIPYTLDALAYAGGAFAIGWGALSFLFGMLGAGRE